MNAEPQKEHAWLQKLVGEWTYEVEAVMAPGQPPVKVAGRARASARSADCGSLGEGQGEMPGGGPATTLITLGYDPSAKRFVGTWVGSMMTHLWVYDGALDTSGKVLTLDAEGPSFAGDGKMAKYQDITRSRATTTGC